MEKELEKRMKAWDKFTNWCKFLGYKPGDGKVLRKYVKLLKEGKWDYGF